MSTKTIAGVKFTSQGSGFWLSEDGRFEIRKDAGVSYCDGPHPVREKSGRGSMCWGNEEHPDWTWGIWDNQTGDWLNREPNPVDTMREAVEDFERWMSKQEDK